MEKIVLNKNEFIKVKQLMEQSKNTPSSNNGPKLYKLSERVVNLLNDRIKDEYYAHSLYRAAANWCHDQNYKKAASFFDADAKTELEHAEMIQKYMTDFNIVPYVEGSKEEFEFDNLIDIVHQAYEFELYLMRRYNKDSQEVFAEDLTTFDFLQQFRKIQQDSVVEFNDLINASNLVDKSDKFQVLYFEQTYF